MRKIRYAFRVKCTTEIAATYKDEDKKKMLSFFLSFDVATITIPTDVAPADAVEAMSKDGFKKEAADGTPRTYAFSMHS